MISLDDYTNENKIKHSSIYIYILYIYIYIYIYIYVIYSRSYIQNINNRQFWIGKNKRISYLINNQLNIDKIYLYAKD